MTVTLAGVGRRCHAALAALRGREPADSDAPIAVDLHAGGGPPRAGSPGWWDLVPFTTHRIMLAPGIYTAPTGVEAADDVRVDVVVNACGGSLDGRTIVDLGCLEGGFTIAFATRGADPAVGIEAREISVRRCQLAADLLGVDNAHFVQADIKDELARSDPFDVVFAAGILYHVADPLALLTAMRRACTHFALIDTHVAAVDVATHDCSELVTRTFAGHPYRGRLFPEYAPTTSTADKDDLLWAAWSDADSFWPLESDLVEMIRSAGFAQAKKIDLVADGLAPRWGVDQTNRVMYLAEV
jgi:SAM-dependent methyltransferase